MGGSEQLCACCSLSWFRSNAMMQLDPSTSSISASSECPTQVEVNINYMDRDLFKAAEVGDIEPFDKYQGDLLCLVDGRQNTALHIYSRTGGRRADQNEREFSFVKQLVSKCSSLLLRPNDRGEIPLHIAAKHGHSGIVKILIERAKSLQHEDLEEGLEATIRLEQMLRMRDKDGNTAMHKAVQSADHPHVVRVLMKELDPDFSFSANKSGETPLYIAAKRGTKLLLDEILDNCKSVEYGGPDGRTALHAAVMAKNEERVRKLIEANKHLTKETDDNGRTALHYATLYDCHSFVKLLLESDASAAYITDKERGMTALHLAAWQGRKDIMEEIISHCPGCCEIVDKRGWNFLHFAVLTLDPKELERFLSGEKKKNKDFPVRNLLDEKDVNGNSPFNIYFYRPVGYGGYNYYNLFLFFASHSSESHKYISSSKQTKNKQVWKLLKDIADDEEVAGLPIHFFRKIVMENDKLEEEMNNPEEVIEEQVRESHLLVATLVATVTFTATFTVPGGYNEQQGTATLIRDSAFKAFVISNTLAFVASLLAITFHFILVMLNRGFLKKDVQPALIRRADQLTVFAMAAMVVAFSTGTYAVLQSFSGFAITALLFTLVFFPVCVALFLFDFIHSSLSG